MVGLDRSPVQCPSEIVCKFSFLDPTFILVVFKHVGCYFLIACGTHHTVLGSALEQAGVMEASPVL